MATPTGIPHPECVDAMRAHLRRVADEHYAAYQRLDRAKRTRGYAKVQRRMAVAFGWTAGQLRDLVSR